MRTAFVSLASAIPGLLVHLDLEAVQELVESAEQVDHGHELKHGSII